MNIQKAMILAAGRGERMRPLTDKMPKPLLEVAGMPLIEHHVRSIVKAGISELIINHAHLGEQIEQCLGDGSRFNCSIEYSAEGQGQALETGGGIFRVLEKIQQDFFLVVNSDIWTDFDYAMLDDIGDFDAHLVMVSNPSHNPEGDFSLSDGKLSTTGSSKLTFSGIGIYRKQLFAGCSPGKFPLAPLLKNAMQHHRVSGQLFTGKWIDVGTPERLEQAAQLIMQ